MPTLPAGGPFFFDGAFGTYFSTLVPNGESCELANLTNPELVLRIHREYIDAGANAILTNTFAANAGGMADEATRDAVLEAGYRLACQAAEGCDVVVFADIGYRMTGEDVAAREEYAAIARRFLALGARHFAFETFGELDVIRPALALIHREAPEAFVLVSFGVSQDGTTTKGHDYRVILRQAAAVPGVGAVGLNCICGPSHLLRLVRALDLSQMRLCVMPNSGYPTSVTGRLVFEDNTAYFSQKVAEMYRLGVNLLGGCCGTTPRHIRQMIRLVRQTDRGNGGGIAGVRPSTGPVSERNALREAFASGRKVVVLEVDPPLDTRAGHLLRWATLAREAGVDAITVADSPLARSRADSMMIAAKIRRESGVEVIPHLSCRDRNAIGIQSALLGGRIESLSSVLVVTGDPVVQDRGKGVFNFQSFGLMSTIQSLNEGLFQAAPYFIGGALNVNAPRFEVELERAKRKIDAGGGFFITQPIFEERAVENLRRAHEALDAPILAGIMPPASYRNALFLSNEVVGIRVPQSLLDGMRDLPDDEALALSRAFALSLLGQVESYCEGYCFMPQLRKVKFVCDIVREALAGAAVAPNRAERTATL